MASKKKAPKQRVLHTEGVVDSKMESKQLAMPLAPAVSSPSSQALGNEMNSGEGEQEQGDQIPSFQPPPFQLFASGAGGSSQTPPDESNPSPITIDSSTGQAEQEADRVAKNAVQGAGNFNSGQTPETVYQKSSGNGGEELGPEDSEQLRKTKGGTPLSGNTKTTMENSIGADLSKARLHTDTKASELAAKLNAEAFTYGNEIFFGKGRFNPETIEGRHLLAHELTHLLQQQQSEEPFIQKFEAQYHEQVEQASLTGEGGLSNEEASSVYRGNWMRDLNQVFVPFITNILNSMGIDPSVALLLANYLSIDKFGQTMSPEQFGFYKREEHMDNPVTSADEDVLPENPITEEPGIASGKPAIPESHTTESGPVSPHSDVLGADLFSVDQTGTLAFIRRSNIHVEQRLELAAQKGRNPEGLMHFGAALHTVEDLFAHSNWIEIAVSKVLSDSPDLLQELQGEDREVFNYAPSVDVGNPEDKGEKRPVMTTGSFNSQDTAISISHIISGFLEKEPPPPASYEEARAKEQETLKLIQAFESIVANSKEVQGELKIQLNFLDEDILTKVLSSGTLSGTYGAILNLMDWVPEGMRKRVQEARINIEAKVAKVIWQGTQQIAKTIKASHQVPETEKTAPMNFAREQNEIQTPGSIEEKRSQNIENSPEGVVAGPSHSQISKDHENSIFFGLAFTLAAEADRRIRDKMINAWAGSGESKPYDFSQYGQQGSGKEAEANSPESQDSEIYHAGREGNLKAGNESREAGNEILKDGGGEMYEPTEEIIAEKVQKMRTSINALKFAHQNFPKAQLADLIAYLEEITEMVANAKDHKSRESASNEIAVSIEKGTKLLSKATGIPAEFQGITGQVLKNLETTLLEISPLVDVAYSSEQREILDKHSGDPKAKASVFPDKPLPDMKREDVSMPDSGQSFDGKQRSPAVTELIEESRMIINHPYESNWWEPTVRSYIAQHKDRILMDIRGRNAGVPAHGTGGHGHSE